MTDTKAMALRLCQKAGMATMFTDTNEGMSLPLEISKKIAIEMIREISSLEKSAYWIQVIEEIGNL